MERIRKFPLSINPDAPVYGLGLLTDEPDYRICWLLNQHFSWGLARTDDLTTSDKNSPVPQSFSCFISHENHLPVVKLISNRSNEGLWLTVFRQVNFLLIISSGSPAESYTNEIKSGIVSKIPQIRGLFKVPLPSFCYL